MKIQTYLRKHRLTQQEFGAQTGFSQSMVAQWLTKVRPISALAAIKIEKGTGGVINRRELRPDIFNE